MKITIHKFILPLLIACGSAHGAVLIGNDVNNGQLEGFTGWNTAWGNVYDATVDSTLTSGPFGVQSPGSTSFYINDDGGAAFLSDTFSLTVGDKLAFAFDYLSQHSNSVTMTIAVVDAEFDFFQQIYGFTSAGISGFVLHEVAAVDFTGATGSYSLFIQYDPSVAAADIQVDRIYLAAVPEPSGALLLSGGLGLALLRRKRRSA